MVRSLSPASWSGTSRTANSDATDQWLSLLVLGIVWLWQGGHVWIWALAAGSIGLLSWPLWHSVKRRSKQGACDLVRPAVDGCLRLHIIQTRN